MNLLCTGSTQDTQVDNVGTYSQSKSVKLIRTGDGRSLSVDGRDVSIGAVHGVVYGLFVQLISFLT